MSRIDWDAEAYTAARAGDWRAFVYCLTREPELVCMQRPLRFNHWWIAIGSGAWPTVQALLELGADVDRSETTVYALELDDEPRRRIGEHTRLKRYPGFNNPTVSALSLAWWLGARDLHAELMRRVSGPTRLQSLLWALLTNDEAWLDAFAIKDTLAGTSRRHDGEFTPATAAIFGGVSAETFARIWNELSPELRSANHRVSTAPPGHEEGHHDYPEGDALVWAERLGRTDIADVISARSL